MRALPWIRAVVGLGALALFLAAAVPVSLRSAESFAGWALERYRLDAVGARSAVFGEPYVRRLEQIRRLIPKNAAYFLVNAVPKDEGSLVWVRYDLAPRRAIFLGSLGRLKRRQLRLVRSPAVEWVVISYGAAAPPRVLPRQELMDSLVRRLGP